MLLKSYHDPGTAPVSNDMMVRKASVIPALLDFRVSSGTQTLFSNDSKVHNYKLRNVLNYTMI